MKKVSVLVPIYGVEKYIERCARSLFEQTYSDIEYIFVDDCSQDKSIDILHDVMADYPNRRVQTRIIQHKYNRGLAAARNTAVDASSGEYLMHIDSDDFLDLNAVEILVNKANNTKADILIFGTRIIAKDGKRINNSPVYFDNKVAYIKSILLHSTPASIWNKFYHAAFYKSSGIRSIDGVNYGEDYAVTPRLIYKACSIETMDSSFYNYELNNSNSYTNQISVNNIKELKLATEVLKKFFLNVEDKDKYYDAIQVIDVRSMLALLKKARKEMYGVIRKEFIQCINKKYNMLNNTDRLLLMLLRYRAFKIISILLTIHKSVYR